MSFVRVLRNLLTHSAASALLTALSNALGSGVLTATNHEGHDAVESITISMSGAALLAAVLDLTFNSCFNDERDGVTDNFLLRLLWSYVFTQLLGPVLGRLIFSASDSPTMSLAQIEADAALGMAICIVPFCCIAGCIINYEPPMSAYQRLPDGPSTLRRRLADCYSGEIDPDYRSVISSELMNDPVSLKKCGHNFDREDLPEMKERCQGRCPTCRESFCTTDFTAPTPNVLLRGLIIKFVEEKERLKRAGAVVVVEVREEKIAEEQKVSEVLVTLPIKKKNAQILLDLGIDSKFVDAKFICPLTKKIMDKPVRASDGQVYEESSLKVYIHLKDRKSAPVISPVTGQVLVKTGNAWYHKAHDIDGRIAYYMKHKQTTGNLANGGVFGARPIAVSASTHPPQTNRLISG